MSQTEDGRRAVEERDMRAFERPYGTISPFEFKNKLIELAQGHQQKSTRVLLDAGRGNPNWIAATPREAFFALGQFAVEVCRRVWDEDALAGKARRPGIAEHFRKYVWEHRGVPGIELLRQIVDYGVNQHGFTQEEWLFELVDGIIGDNYPLPDRMLVRVEQVVHDFLMQELCGSEGACGDFQLFAVEGATAAMCYIFDTLIENYLLDRGDKVAVAVPIFPPYVEIPHLYRYNFDVVKVIASGIDSEGRHTWQYPESEIDKLRDPSVKALFLVNPSNPPSVAMDDKTRQQLLDVVKNDNPNLMIITDDVYSTFVDGFRSLLADLPHNTIGVYSFSKYFGVTGWRLGVVAVHKQNVFDKLLRDLPEDKKQILDGRYSSLTRHPRDIAFLDRIVADSRQVAMNHTAGLSTPQQVQMAIFCAFALLDKENRYKDLTKNICRRRMKLLYESLGLPEPHLPQGAYYYTEFDLEEWATRHFGSAFTEHLKNTYEPIDILFRLAEQSSIVLLNGGGFYGPEWSIRVSLANLDDDAYSQIGKDLHTVLEQYVSEWETSRART